MRENERQAETFLLRGHFLIDCSVYNRTPELTPIELTDLQKQFQGNEPGKSQPRRNYQAVKRIVIPFHDVVCNTHVSNAARCQALRVLLWEMWAREKTFWGWTQDEWVEVLCQDGHAFQKKYSLQNASGRLPLKILSYIFGGVTNLHLFGHFEQRHVADLLFGQEIVEETLQTVIRSAQDLGYRRENELTLALLEALIQNRSTALACITFEQLEILRSHSHLSEHIRQAMFTLSHALVNLTILERPLNFMGANEVDKRWRDVSRQGIDSIWLHWCQRWHQTSTLSDRHRRIVFTRLLKVGRWLSSTYPEIVSPEQWNRELAAEYVSVVDRMEIGQWVSAAYKVRGKWGKPIAPRTKDRELGCLRTFFRDCQEWGWIARRFDPGRSFATPRPILSLIGPDPRVIADDIWAKLLWAGLNVSEEDLPRCGNRSPNSQREGWLFYPLEMVRALAVVWLFAGLRSDEIRRLRLGCLRWQQGDTIIHETGEVLSKKAVCLLDIPTNKTGTAFTKPVDPLVGEAIAQWESIRPAQPSVVDRKTSQFVHYLFSYRGVPLGRQYLNDTLIPLLCRKGGVPEQDARGNITSHRARSTIATQLFNAREPMSLFELQEWLGHRDPKSTQSYAKITPTKLAKAYADAGYFERNTRVVEVLIDQDVVRSGAAVHGDPWRFYDLGHGYCTYDFFDQCPHRMACAKCSFYLPKTSSQVQLLEAKANLQRFLQSIPLSDDERAAVEDGIEAVEKLCAKLADIPTPAGPTPRQLTGDHQEQPQIITISSSKRKQSHH